MREQEWFLDLVTDQRDPCVTSSPHGKVRKESETKQPLKAKILILDSCVSVRSLDAAYARCVSPP